MSVVEIRSVTGGSVSLHVAFVGQQVEEGAAIMIVECMKTEIPVDAPRRGVVSWLKACGDIVEPADVVATLDVPDAAPP